MTSATPSRPGSATPGEGGRAAHARQSPAASTTSAVELVP
jgi:hypothetical protein